MGDSQRLMVLLNRWPIPIKDSLDFMAAEIQEFKGDRETANEFMGVLRSKGFCWMAPAKWSSTAANNDSWRHDTAMYWSHAGISASLPRVSGGELLPRSR